MRSLEHCKLIICSVSIFFAAYGCSSPTTNTSVTDSVSHTSDSIQPKTSAAKLRPKGPKPAWAPDIHPEMQVVIEKLISYNAPAIETLTPEKARLNPTPAMAVMDVMKDNNIPTPVSKVDTVGQNIPVAGGTIHIRIYTPKAAMTTYPIILYIHGGGFVIADINTYDASAASMSEQTGAVVISVEYRKGPEHKFPVAHNDCFAAYQWALKNAASYKGDTAKIAVLGESAGGNLAANVCIMAREKKIKVPVAAVLVYPIAQPDMNTASYQKNAMAKPLNKAMMAWFAKNYLPSMALASDPRMDLTKANLKGFPTTLIITDEIDPLQTDGEMLRDAMKKAGVDVSYQNYDGVTHEFFGMAAVVPEAREAQALAASHLKKAFDN